jgi:hypothetical protein
MLVCVMLGLISVSPAIAGHHEAVLQVVAVDVKPGKLEDYQKEVKKLQAILKRLGSKATMRMWSNTQGGPATGTILVGLEFANVEAWASDSAKFQADEEWEDILGNLHKLRTLEGSSIWTDISPNASEGGGSVLIVTSVSVNPGKLEAYRQELAKLKHGSNPHLACHTRGSEHRECSGWRGVQRPRHLRQRTGKGLCGR